MKYEVVNGYDSFEFDSDNQNLQFAVICWVDGIKQVVKVFEDENKASRFEKSQINKFNKSGIAGRVGKFVVVGKRG